MSVELILYNQVNHSIDALFSYYINVTIVIAFTDFLLKETGHEKARTKNAPEPHIPRRTKRVVHTYAYLPHLFYA